MVVHYMYLFESKIVCDLLSGYGRRDAVEHLLAVGANVHARDDGGLVNMPSIFIDDIKLEYHQLLDRKYLKAFSYYTYSVAYCITGYFPKFTMWIKNHLL